MMEVSVECKQDWADLFKENANHLLKGGYYDFRSDGKAPSLQQHLEDGFLVIGEYKPSSPTGNRYFQEMEGYKRLKAMAAEFPAISVLVEPNYFCGDILALREVIDIGKPVIFKDVIFYEEQILAARNCSAVVLIFEYLGLERVRELVEYCHKEGVEPIVEVHEEENYRIVAKEVDCRIIAINNRNLKKMHVDVGHGIKLVKRFKPKNKHVLSFSGYSRREEILRAKGAGFSGVLVGTALSKATDPISLYRKMAGGLNAH